MRVKIKIFVLTLLVLTVGQGILYAGTTGKIAGVITDAKTGEPLAGVNIVIKGTSMGAASDFDGNYVILNIPPRVYTVILTMIGYQRIQYENVRVGIDLTTTLDAELKMMTLDLGETVVVTAERKLVVKDMTSSLSITTAEQIQNLPVQNLQEVLRLNAGIIESDGRLHIRGGRPGEVAYWVDGVSATDVYDGRIATTVENSAIQELQVISGTFNAEYGQAMSGIVNIITKEGGKNYTGQIKVYGGDYVSNDDRFGLYRRTTWTESDTITGLTIIHPSKRVLPLKKINPIYNGEFSLSGPAPLFGNNLTFFTNGRYFYDEGYFYGMNWFKPNGTSGDSTLVVMNPYLRTSMQGKLTYNLSSALKLSYNLFWDKQKRDRNYNRLNSLDYQYNPTGEGNFSQFTTHDYLYVPNGLPHYFGEGFTHTFTLTHLLSPSTFYELRTSRYHSSSKQYVYKNPTKKVEYLVSIQEDTISGIVPEKFDPFTDQGRARLDSIKAIGGRFEYVVDPDGPDGYIDPDIINSPTSYSFMNKGMDVTHTERSTKYWVTKLDFTSQLNKTNQLKFGSEIRLHELTLHGFQIIAQTDDSTGLKIDPFQPAVPEEGNIFRNDYVRKPKEISAYIQDKIEIKDIILNLGLRYDYFDANSFIPTDPTDPNIYAPFRNEHIYKDLNGDDIIGIDEQVKSNEYSPDERRAFMQTKVDAKISLSPRLGISFPITDRGVIHFSYGHFFQIPEFQYLYGNPDFKITSSSGKAIFGNADLEPQRTVMYELGLQQQLSDDIGVDLTLFYRDVRDWIGTSPTIATAKTAVVYSRFENKDYSNIRGITIKAEKRISSNYSFRADYTYQSAEGTYSNPTDAYNAALRNQAPVLALVPMNWDQKHTFNAQFVYDISNWTFSLIGRYWSGRPYTPSFPVSEMVGASAVSGLTINSTRRSAQKGIDLTINKSFRLFSRVKIELFMNVYNLFDQRDETNVYSDTGTAQYTTTIDPSKIPYNADRVSTVEDFVNQPNWYSAPRQVHFGLIIGF